MGSTLTCEEQVHGRADRRALLCSALPRLALLWPVLPALPYSGQPHALPSNSLPYAALRYHDMPCPAIPRPALPKVAISCPALFCPPNPVRTYYPFPLRPS